jgi:hypothetical protein
MLGLQPLLISLLLALGQQAHSASFTIAISTEHPTVTAGADIWLKNLTAHFCSTKDISACYTKQYFVKLVINPGGIFSLSSSSAAIGTASTNF